MFFFLGLVQLGLILGTVTFVTYFFPTESFNFVGSWETLDKLGLIFRILSYISIAFLLYKVWKSNSLEKRVKYIWIFYLLVIPIIAGTYYIWGYLWKSNES